MIVFVAAGAAVAYVLWLRAEARRAPLIDPVLVTPSGVEIPMCLIGPDDLESVICTIADIHQYGVPA